MAAYIIQEETLNNIGDAIRGKTGKADKLSPAEMVVEINNLNNYDIEPLTITSNGIYTATDGVSGYNPITVKVPLDYVESLESYFREIYTFDNGRSNLNWSDTGTPLGNQWRDWVANTFHINGDIYYYANPVVNAYRFCYNNTALGDTISSYMILKIYNGVLSLEGFFEGCTNFKGNFNFLIHCPDIGDYSGLDNQDMNSYFVGTTPALTNMFKGCHNLQRFPKAKPNNDYTTPYEDYYPDPFFIFRCNGISSLEGIFYDCYSLRQIPAFGWYEWYGANHMSWDSTERFLRNGGYNEAFKNCYALDYIKDLPVSEISVGKDKQIFTDMVSGCFRINALTFKYQDDGTPYTANWTKQCLDLSNYVGYGDYPLIYQDLITSYNSGITSSFKVKDDETYQALKDTEDWYTYNAAYSRYNKLSAAETIHSLPDTSAYAVDKDTINIIKFTGIAGDLTDGGAINTLSDSDIAVAAAKGWTVAYV